MAGRIAYLGNIATQGLVLDLDAGIKGSYPGVGTTWSDISNNGNNGTLTNGPTFTGSNYGAIVFDGVNDYVDISGSSISSFGTGDFGISTWINFNNLTSNYYRDIIGSSNNSAYLGANKSGWVCAYYSGSGNTPQFKLSYQSNNSWIFEQGFFTRITQSQWYNINYIRNSGTITLYQNGSPTSSSLVTTNIVSTEPFIRLGGGYGSGGGLLNGSIANTQIYNRALSQFQVWQNFNAYKSRYGIPDIVTDGLVLNLDAGNPYSYLSGSSGTTWTNTVAVSSSVSGSLVNGPVYSNGAITFDGVNDYVSIPYSSINPILSGSTSLSISTWVYLNNYHPVDGTSLVTWPVSNNSAVSPFTIVSISTNTTGTIFVQVGNGVTRTTLTSNQTASLNTWLHIGLVWDGAVIKSTLNGVISSASASAVYTLGTPSLNANLFLGTYNTNNVYWLNGKIANTQIYNRALTQTEITQNFNALRGRYGV